MKYLNIVPLVNLPLNRPNYLTYCTDKDIGAVMIGQLAKIRVLGKSQLGIIADISNINPLESKGIKLLPIDGLPLPFPVITPEQFKLAEFTADYYLASLGIVLKSFLPELPAKINVSDFDDAAKLKMKSKSKSTVMLQAPFEERLQTYNKEIAACLEQKLQVLVLVPELASVLKLSDHFNYEFKDAKAAVFHSQISRGEYFKNYLSALSGEAKIILGTRQSIFAPLINPGLIIVEGENNSSHKQWDMMPRYDGRRLAEFRSEALSCPLIFGSASPTIERFYRIAPGGKSKRSGPEKPAVNESLEVIDMKDELKAGNFSMISERLKLALADAIMGNKQALILMNRRAYSTFVLCRDCGYVARCSRCEASMVEYGNGTLGCLHCGANKPAPVVCPDCSSHRIKGFGSGLEKAYAELKTTLPDAAIARYDQDIARKKSSLNKLFLDFDTGQYDILIGTQPILAWKNRNVGITAFLNIDSLLSFPDFRSQEKTFALIRESAAGSASKSIVQTYNPDSDFFTLLKNDDYLNFYENEISARKKSAYPPFSKIIKIISKDSDMKKASLRCESIKQEVLNLNKDLLAKTRLIGPYAPAVAKVRDEHLSEMLIFLDGAVNSSQRKQLYDLLKRLSANVSFDVDPENFA